MKERVTISVEPEVIQIAKEDVAELVTSDPEDMQSLISPSEHLVLISVETT